MKYTNVNGVPLTLSIEATSENPRSKSFSINFGSNENHSFIAMELIILAVMFNFLAIFYLRFNVITIINIMIVMFYLLHFWVSRTVQFEKIVVLPSIGIQCSVKYVFGREDKFVPWSSIDDVIINEVIEMNRVIYFLTILIKDETNQSEQEQLIPLFKYTKPRLHMIKAVYSELQSLLAAEVADKEATRFGSGDTG